MMKKKGDSGKHRPVIAKKARQNISQEPQMQELKALLSQMDDEEIQRTIEYLDEQKTGPLTEDRIINQTGDEA